MLLICLEIKTLANMTPLLNIFKLLFDTSQLAWLLLRRQSHQRNVNHYRVFFSSLSGRSQGSSEEVLPLDLTKYNEV